MKTIKTFFLLFASTLFLIGCSSDDNNNSQDPPDNTNELIESLIANVTGGSETIWKIESASLTNNTVTDLDVSNTFNITDDEYVFKTVANSQTIALEHRQGNAFNESATDINDFLLDFYKSAENTSLTIVDVTSKVFGDSNKSFTYNSETNMTAELSLSNATLSIELSPKTALDFASPPNGGLNFTEIMTIQKSFGLGIVGFTGANQNNSLFIANRDGSIPTVYKYDLNTNTLTENTLDPNSDFVTKKALIVNNQLKVFGANYVTTYDLDIESTPTSINHGLNLSRFGFTTLNEDIYFIGGDIDTPADKIRLYNESTNNPQVVATIPTPKSWAGSEIVNSKLYIFGGQTGFNPGAEDPESISYIYNLDDNSFTNFNLPQALFASYPVRYQNLIYVAGNIGIDADDDGVFEDFDNFFGAYNTLDDTFTEIMTDLDNSGTNTIKGITVFNNKIYALYGDVSGGTTKIMAADI